MLGLGTVQNSTQSFVVHVLFLFLDTCSRLMYVAGTVALPLLCVLIYVYSVLYGVVVHMAEPGIHYAVPL